MHPYDIVRERFAFPFELRPLQVDIVNDLCQYPRAGYYCEAGCVDSDTEYLSPTGWIKISEYAGGEVLQYTLATGETEFVTPIQYIKAPCKQMTRIKTKYGVDQLLSDDHRMLAFRGNQLDKGPVVFNPGYLMEKHDRFHSGDRARRPEPDGVSISHVGLPSVFFGPERAGVNLTDDQLRLQVAVIADGHFGGPTDRCVVRIKKARKVGRLRRLLEAAGVEYVERDQNTPTAKGFSVFTFSAPLRLKEFDARFWAASRHQMSILAAEIPMWDGTMLGGNRGVSFTSTSRASADFAQYVFCSQGVMAGLWEDPRTEKYRGGQCLTVTARGGSKNTARGLRHILNKLEPTMWTEPSTDGFKYCFTVPSSFLVLRRNGCVFITGNSGKTSMATHQALYYRDLHGVRQWLIVMPPILLEQWDRWLRSVTDLSTGKPLTTTVYAGTPAQRKALSLNNDFVLTSYGLLKNDFESLHAHFEDRALGVIADEATAIKNTASDTHKAVALIAENRPFLPLTGTPINKPGDAFAYIKLIAPGVYRNRRQFDRLHVAETDDYGNVEKWCNLDVLAENMKIHSGRLLLRDARKDMPEPLLTPRPYKLDPAHMKLYRRIAEERLVEFEGGKEIDAISASALRSALQQVVINWAEFDDNTARRPAIMDMIEEVLEEIGERKLVIAAHFIRTNRYLHKALAKYDAVAVYGEVAKADKQKAIRRFIEDSQCRVILVQPSSAGFGVDGLQHVCSDMLVVEAPTTPTPFQQVVARLDRDGQKEPVHVRVAIASGTVQVGMFKSLLNNDELANQVQGGYKTLRSSIYGGE